MKFAVRCGRYIFYVLRFSIMMPFVENSFQTVHWVLANELVQCNVHGYGYGI